MCVFHISHIQIMPQNLQCKDILVCYLDYLDRLVIYIYSKSQEEHHEHLRIVFQILRGKKLNAKLKSYANQGNKLTCLCIKDLKALFVW